MIEIIHDMISSHSPCVSARPNWDPQCMPIVMVRSLLLLLLLLLSLWLIAKRIESQEVVRGRRHSTKR